MTQCHESNLAMTGIKIEGVGSTSEPESLDSKNSLNLDNSFFTICPQYSIKFEKFQYQDKS